MSEKLVYANGDFTVHLSQGTVDNQFGSFEIVEGKNLRAGETVPLNSLAKYQQDKIVAGEVPGLEVVSASEASSRAEQLAKLAAVVAAQSGNQVFEANKVLGDDGSFSDHLVSDAQKIANHAAQAGGGEAPVVATAENADSPVYAGVTDEPEVVEEQVTGSGGEKADTSKSSSSKNK